MQARKKANASKTDAKKAGVKKSNAKTAKQARAKTATAKATAGSARAKKARTTKLMKAGTAKAGTKKTGTKKTGTKTSNAKLAKTKRPSVRAKSTTKAGGRRAARKSPIARRNAPKTPNRAPMSAISTRPKAGQANRNPNAQREESTIREDDATDFSATTTETPARFEISREPVRGGFRDGANHSKPEVQLQRQHTQTMRSPERRHTMRGH